MPGIQTKRPAQEAKDRINSKKGGGITLLRYRRPCASILLNAFRDKAFDKGFISINTSFEIIVSPKLSGIISDMACNDWFMSFQGKEIILPEKFIPEKQFIEYHNDVVFMR